MSIRRYEGEQTKKHIVAKALILFSQKGYAATSIEDIVAASGCSKGSIYYHFKNKEDLFLYLTEQAFTESWEQWEKISIQYKSTTEKLYAYADYCADNFQKPLNSVGEEFLTRVGADSETGQKFFAIMNSFIKGYEKLMSEGIARGEFKNENPKELTLIFLSLHIGLNHSCHVMGMEKDAIKTIYHKATTLFLQGISAKEEP